MYPSILLFWKLQKLLYVDIWPSSFELREIFSEGHKSMPMHGGQVKVTCHQNIINMCIFCICISVGYNCTLCREKTTNLPKRWWGKYSAHMNEKVIRQMPYLPTIFRRPCRLPQQSAKMKILLERYYYTYRPNGFAVVRLQHRKNNLLFKIGNLRCRVVTL